MNMKKGIIIVLFFLAAVELQAQDYNNFKIGKSIEVYSNVMRQLNLNYVDTIHPVDLTDLAIKNMLASLDPYTIYVPEKEKEQFQILTRGEYGGIGAMIQKQDDYVVVTDPYEGFPAQNSGLRAGDKIIKIDGKSAKNMSADEVSNLLKGTPGSKIQVTVQHFGDSTDIAIDMTRQKIKIPNVPYYGVLKDDIGYISLNQFNPNAANDVRNAFLDLKNNHHIKGVILDLRNNGGGLVNEAINIANIFVKRGTEIAKTIGKLQSNDYTYRTTGKVVDADIPLAILVNQNTASASEIVSGSMQDLDRGVIIGQRTFGKGLVQNIVPLPYGGELKVTIAKYYIPSGRCIQAIDYAHKNKQGQPLHVADSLRKAFKTKDGRVVYDGGGITPDVKMKPLMFSQVTGDLYAQNYIFNFANMFAFNHKSISGPDSFSISDSTFNAFKDYVKSKGFSYETETGALLKRLKESAQRENYYQALKPELDSLGQELQSEKKEDLNKHKSEIEELLRLEIVGRYYYQQGKAKASLVNDNEVKKAIQILSDKKEYESILKPKKEEIKDK
ncbi:MAG: S41 family peptidase [Bacteroidales bacterium]|nr:S41 family peptidase [Bacteroidales bacterium]